MAFLCMYIHHSFPYSSLVHLALLLLVFLSPNSSLSCFLSHEPHYPLCTPAVAPCIFLLLGPTSVSYMWMHIDVHCISKKEVWHSSISKISRFQESLKFSCFFFQRGCDSYMVYLFDKSKTVYEGPFASRSLSDCVNYIGK